MSDRLPVTETMLANARLPEIYWDTSMYQHQQEHIRFFENIPKWLKTNECVLLLGDPGTGKTGFTSVVLKEALSLSHRSLYVCAAEVPEFYSQKLSAADNSDTGANRLRNASLLIIDAVSGDRESSHLVSYLLRFRYQQKKPTILATNSKSAEIKKKYPSDLRRTMKHVCRQIILFRVVHQPPLDFFKDMTE